MLFRIVTPNRLKTALECGDTSPVEVENGLASGFGHFRMTGFLLVPFAEKRLDFDESWYLLGQDSLEYQDGRKSIQSIAFDFFMNKCSQFMKDEKIKLTFKYAVGKDAFRAEDVDVFTFNGYGEENLIFSMLVSVDHAYFSLA